jgi:hypothetical protein
MCVHVGDWDRIAHVHLWEPFSVRKAIVHWSDPQNWREFSPAGAWLTKAQIIATLCIFFCRVGLMPPLGPFFRSPRFRFLRTLCSSPLGPSTTATHWPIVHSPDDTCGWLWSNYFVNSFHNYWVIGGANDCRGNWRTRRKPAPAPLCPTTNPTWPGPVSNPGPQQWEASD